MPRTAAQHAKDQHIARSKNFVSYTEDELWEMSREEASETLNDRQARWCEIYVRSFNLELAAVKAGYSKASAFAISNRLRRREDIRTYLAWLKLRAVETLDIRPIDILNQYAKLAFADITDFMTVKNGRLSFVDSDMIDGQVVKSYKVGAQGMSIELYDKLSALKHLENFFDDMPKSWQQRLEERRMEIAEEKLEIEKQALGNPTLHQVEIGSSLLEALKSVASNTWEKESDEGTEGE